MINGLDDYMKDFSEERKAVIYEKARVLASKEGINNTEGSAMKISGYIKMLESQLAEHGDLPVVKAIVFECTGDQYYDYDVSVSVDVVEDGWKVFDTEDLVTDEKVLVITSLEEF